MEAFIKICLDYLIKLLPSIITGLFLFYWQRAQKKRDSENEEKETLKDEAEDIDREINSATMELAYATSIAVEKHKTNGEMKAARKAYENAKKKQEAFNLKLQKKVIDN